MKCLAQVAQLFKTLGPINIRYEEEVLVSLSTPEPPMRSFGFVRTHWHSDEVSGFTSEHFQEGYATQPPPGELDHSRDSGYESL